MSEEMIIYPGTDLILLHLPLRICSIINGYQQSVTIDDLTKYTAAELLENRGLGIKGVQEIRKFLQSQNKCLRDDILVTEEQERQFILSIPETLKTMSQTVREMSRQLRILQAYLDQIKASVVEKNDDNR